MIPLAGSRILVPLDGSAAAEHALAPAARIAQATGSSIVLARIVPVRMWTLGWPGTAIPEDVYQRLLEDEDKVTLDYLTHMADELATQSVSAQIYTERGAAADLLLRLEQRFRTGLVVMTTHGRTGMARLALGSIADRIVRAGRAPVLLVRPFAAASNRANTLGSALVPLDGSPVSETVLGMVEQLAGSLVRRVTLLRSVNAVEPASAYLEAQQYIEAQRLKLIERLDRLQCEVTVTATVVLATGEAAPSILAQASHDYDLIMMATHGDTGVRRWAVGSVADGVLCDTPVPLLLVHAYAQRNEPADDNEAET